MESKTWGKKTYDKSPGRNAPVVRLRKKSAGEGVFLAEAYYRSFPWRRCRPTTPAFLGGGADQPAKAGANWCHGLFISGVDAMQMLEDNGLLLNSGLGSGVGGVADLQEHPGGLRAKFVDQRGGPGRGRGGPGRTGRRRGRARIAMRVLGTGSPILFQKTNSSGAVVQFFLFKKQIGRVR